MLKIILIWGNMEGLNLECREDRSFWRLNWTCVVLPSWKLPIPSGNTFGDVPSSTSYSSGETVNHSQPSSGWEWAYDLTSIFDSLWNLNAEQHDKNNDLKKKRLWWIHPSGDMLQRLVTLFLPFRAQETYFLCKSFAFLNYITYPSSKCILFLGSHSCFLLLTSENPS